MRLKTLHTRSRRSALESATHTEADRAAGPEDRADHRRLAPQRRGDIQGLRALAIVLVVAFHVRGGLPGGFVGVDVFFAVSGFVITSTLVRELDRSETVNLPAFYGRRVKRLLPALTAMLATVAVMGVFLTPVAATHIAGMSGIAAGVFGANVYLGSLPDGYFGVNSSLDPLLHTWSLAVEEQFYVVFPLAVLLAWRIGRRMAVLIALALLSAASYALAEIWSAIEKPLAFYGSPARAWEFGLGALAAVLLPAWRRIPTLVCSAIAAAGVVAIVSAASVPASGSVFDLLVPVGGACLLLVAGSRDNPVSRMLAVPPLRWVGDRSYSWYLWHWPLIVFASALWPRVGYPSWVAAAASLAVAWVSYRFIENPMRFVWRPSGRKVVIFAGFCVAVPVALSAGTLEFRLPVTSAVYAPAWGIEFQRGCHNASPLGHRPMAPCTWPVEDSRGMVVLIGDSNAGHFAEAVIAADRSLRLTTVVATAPWCAFLDHLAIVDTGAIDAPCVNFVRGSLQWLRKERPSLVIIGARTDTYIEDSRFELARTGQRAEAAPAAKARAWEAALRTTASELTQAGIPMLVVHPVPELAAGDRGICASLLLYLDLGCARSDESPRRAVDARLSSTLTAERAALASLPHVSLLDLENAVCGANSCSTVHDGVVMYRDAIHLSIPGALSLTPIFRRAIESQFRPRNLGRVWPGNSTARRDGRHLVG